MRHGLQLRLGTVLSLLAAASSWGQVESGSLYGRVLDEAGGAIPGVVMTLSGTGAPLVQKSDEFGEFHFLGLPPDAYALEAQRVGYSPLRYPKVIIQVGRNTTVELVLLTAVEDTIVITAASPVLDPRKISAGNTVSSDELAKIPTARDPWAILQSTPGVLTDRINVGGNESGQQSQYVGPGAQGDQAVWSLDGMVITDMAAIGGSPGYFDFDAFAEMQVTTGGSEVTAATPGVTLNMVTKRGTNEWRGSGRYLVADDGMQSDPGFDSADLGQAGAWNNFTAQPAFKQGNRIVEVVDWGIEAGGPLIRDKLWIWGAYAKPEIDLLTVSDFSDSTTLEDANVKLNAQVTASNLATLFAWDSDKVKRGRNAGPLRPQETTWDQGKYGPAPTAWKVEDSQIFGSRYFVTGIYSEVNGGFELAPHSGDYETIWFLDLDGISHNNAPAHVQIRRPQKQARAEASAFFTPGAASHELKFGVGYRTADQSSLSHTIGGAGEIELGDGLSLFFLSRDANINARAEYSSLFAQDTLTRGNLTANVGLRFDRQGGENLASSVEANPLRPECLPAVRVRGSGAGFEWESISPRLGATYSLGPDRQTLLRASYSQYADQLATGTAGFLHLLKLQSYSYFLGYTRGDGRVELPDLILPAGLSGNVDPETGGVVQSNGIDPDLAAPITREMLLGVEHALGPEFVVGLQVSRRETQDLLEFERLVFDGNAYSQENLARIGRRHRRDDYVLESGEDSADSGAGVPRILPDGTPYTLNYYELRPGISTRNGFMLENGEREWDYLGASLTWTKRLSQGWMMRGNFTWSDWTWVSPESENEDPTLVLPGAIGAIADGGDVVQASGVGSGAKGNVYIHSQWSYAVNALYQVAPDRPWGFNLAANLTGRQGYPQIYFERVFRSTIFDGPAGINIPVTSNLTRTRLDDVHLLDLRVEKELHLGSWGAVLGVDLFNAANEAFVLQRNGRLTRDNSDHVLEVVSPRIFRLGAKVSFS